MISEGINIKRLRVGVYATNIMTRMFFEQVLGRIIRWQKNIDGAQIAYLFIPRTEPYLTYAKEITEIVDRISKAVQNGKIQNNIWATPGLPMLIFITAGLVIALVFGDLIWIILASLLG